MYYFKANDKDETEYGPLDADQIREWVREERMDNNSLVRKSTDEEWRPLGQVPDWQTSAIPPEGIRPVARTGPPGKVQAIGIMTLVGGIMALVYCLSWGLATLGFWIPWIYSLVLGIMAIMKGSQMLGSNPAPAFASAKTIAIMQIVNIINCDMVNLTLGIITLVFLKDPEVKDWLRSKGVEI
jgi:hypothetical protein